RDPLLASHWAGHPLIPHVRVGFVWFTPRSTGSLPRCSGTRRRTIHRRPLPNASAYVCPAQGIRTNSAVTIRSRLPRAACPIRLAPCRLPPAGCLTHPLGRTRHLEAGGARPSPACPPARIPESATRYFLR